MSLNQTMDKSKWTWRSPSVDKTNLQSFHKTQNSWSNNHMYRTSYHDMSKKVSTALPSPGCFRKKQLLMVFTEPSGP